MLNSTEHEISTSHKKLKCFKINTLFAFKLSNIIFIMLINLKMPTIVGIFTFTRMINYMLISVEHERFISLVPEPLISGIFQWNMVLFFCISMKTIVVVLFAMVSVSLLMSTNEKIYHKKYLFCGIKSIAH